MSSNAFAGRRHLASTRIPPGVGNAFTTATVGVFVSRNVRIPLALPCSVSPRLVRPIRLSSEKTISGNWDVCMTWCIKRSRIDSPVTNASPLTKIDPSVPRQ